MPVRLRQSKRRPEAMPDIEYETIRAGLLGLPCPPAGNPFLHLAAEFPSPRATQTWPRIVAVVASLPSTECAAVTNRHNGLDFVGAD